MDTVGKALAGTLKALRQLKREVFADGLSECTRAFAVKNLDGADVEIE